jgi:hypothetical protein
MLAAFATLSAAFIASNVSSVIVPTALFLIACVNLALSKAPPSDLKIGNPDPVAPAVPVAPVAPAVPVSPAKIIFIYIPKKPKSYLFGFENENASTKSPCSFFLFSLSIFSFSLSMNS